MSKVLVSGGSGFLAGYCILQLLAEGHDVATTVRHMGREPEVRQRLGDAGATAARRLSFFAAELESDAGWVDAVDGCDYVLHIASPFPRRVPKDENELIMPARDGTLRVLRAARDVGVRRVVLTSSFAAVGYGRSQPSAAFSEEDWTPLDVPTPPYIKSKTIAERAAWSFMAREGGSLELSVINPVGIFGPVLGADYSASVAIVKSMLDGTMPRVPEVYFGVVDVRDVAELHIRAMTHPAAKGERFLAVAGAALSMADVADILHRRLGHAAERAPTRQIPNWQVRLAALWSTAAREMVPNLGRRRNSTSEKSRRLLGWAPRSSEEAIVATAQSLIRLGLVDSPSRR